MTQEDNSDLNFDSWYKSNKDQLPPKLKKVMDGSYEFIRFVAEDYKRGMEIISTALHELIRQHYPVFKTETRPLVLGRIEMIVTNAAYSLVTQTYSIIKDQKEGLDFRQQFPNMEELKKRYGKPDEPELVTDEERELYFDDDDAEWEEYKKEENEDILQYFNWETKRKREFMCVSQMLLFKLFKECEELDPDPLILFAGVLVEEYLLYRGLSELLERVIDCGFPAEVVKMPYTEYRKLVDELPKDKREFVYNLRNRRIDGEII